MTIFVKKKDIPVQDEQDIGKVTGIDIKEQYCIGCGLCEKLLPRHFEVIDKKAKWKESILNDVQIDELKPVIAKCPVKAIDLK